VEIDVYNLHMDAGNSTGDLTARAAQVDQLLLEIASRSVGRAIIVAGDTNINTSKNAENVQMLAKLLQQAQLTDACVHTSCGEPERIDRVMYRSSAAVKLEALSWKIDTTFVDSAGVPLSDHDAVGVQMAWEAVSPDGG
jgi:endonuclease/exonuclease/phosphatase family metal-dependent hydrolase